MELILALFEVPVPGCLEVQVLLVLVVLPAPGLGPGAPLGRFGRGVLPEHQRL